MCINNLNVNVAFIDNISRGPNNIPQSVCLLPNDSFISVRTNDAGERTIPELSLAVFVSATQTKNEESVAKIDSNKTFSFAATYECRIRLTETKSGDFIDLGDFEISPANADISQGICRHTFNCTYVGTCVDVPLPSKTDSEKFAIKALIRRKQENAEEADWIVQTIFPFSQRPQL